MKTLKKYVLGLAFASALAVPLAAPSPAQAWWHGGWGWHAGWVGHPGWGWHAGWGWRGGVYVGVPPVVVGAPVAYPGYRWIPGYYAPGGYWVPPHWG